VSAVVDPCVECGETTVFGSGRFVNRIPAEREGPDGASLVGFLCPECLAEECGLCGAVEDRDDLIEVELIHDDWRLLCGGCVDKLDPCGRCSKPVGDGEDGHGGWAGHRWYCSDCHPEASREVQCDDCVIWWDVVDNMYLDQATGLYYCSIDAERRGL
jgi:hypothetical protein